MQIFIRFLIIRPACGHEGAGEEFEEIWKTIYARQLSSMELRAACAMAMSGIGYVTASGIDVGFLIQHFSNGGIKHPNDGVNFADLWVSRSF